MSIHIESIEIQKFRGIKKISIDTFSHINIIVGDNNTGKTSVLEAIQLFCEPTVYGLTKIARQREKYRMSVRMGLSTLDSVLFLFNTEANENSEYRMELSGVINGHLNSLTVQAELIEQIIDLNEVAKHNPIARNKLKNNTLDYEEEVTTLLGEILYKGNSSQQLNIYGDAFDKQSFEINEYTRIINYRSNKNVINNSSLQSADHVLQNPLNRLIRDKHIKDKTIQLLKEFDKTIEDIRYINDDDRFVPVIEDINGKYVPLSLFGDGMKKALTLLDTVVEAENGVALIDEFETALHTSAMKQVFKFLIEIAYALNVQLFLTTHSLEALDKLLLCLDGVPKATNVIRLKKDNENLVPKITTGEIALENRLEYDMELRL